MPATVLRSRLRLAASLFLSYAMPRRPLSHSYGDHGQISFARIRRFLIAARVHEPAGCRSHMIAMTLTHPGFSEAQVLGPSNVAACFAPLDPGVVSASIPTFFVGRDRDG